MAKAFQILDADGSGSISRDELKVVLQRFASTGEDIPDEEKWYGED